MMDFLLSLIGYIGREKDLAREETERRKTLSRDEKIDAGLLLPGLRVVSSVSGPDSTECVFRFSADRMRLRTGERVSLTDPSGTALRGTILETGFDTITVSLGKGSPDASVPWDAESLDSPLYDGFLSALSSIGESDPGARFIEILSGGAAPQDAPPFGSDPAVLALAGGYRGELDGSQMDALLAAAGQPSLHLVQGPPGTGKTRVLSSLASALSRAGMDTAVVAKTPDVLTFDTFGSYLSWRKASRRRGRSSDVVGMTLNAAAVNMCLRNSGFKPQSVLVDEASQIPVAEAAMLGASGAVSVVFFGDDRQMPPIFYPELEGDPLSESVFSRVRRLHPGHLSVLGVSYRMNDEICSLVGSRFYEPFGIHIEPSAAAAPRRMILDRDSADERISGLFREGRSSVVRLDVSGSGSWRDCNPEEAAFAAAVAGYAMRCGVSASDIAVVTPFRRQVALVRAALDRDGWRGKDCPLVDTVERLQGQDVRMIILSFSVTDPVYYASVKDFLGDRNRLNVMVSRAREKVVVLATGQAGIL